MWRKAVGLRWVVGWVRLREGRARLLCLPLCLLLLHLCLLLWRLACLVHHEMTRITRTRTRRLAPPAACKLVAIVLDGEVEVEVEWSGLWCVVYASAPASCVAYPSAPLLTHACLFSLRAHACRFSCLFSLRAMLRLWAVFCLFCLFCLLCLLCLEKRGGGGGIGGSADALLRVHEQRGELRSAHALVVAQALHVAHALDVTASVWALCVEAAASV
jgi:hypothetical protein